MENPSKSHAQIDIVCQDLRSCVADESNWENLPFFRPRPRQITRDTWLISVFVLLQIVIFAVTMGVNDCSANSHGDCTAKLLGRFSFQPLAENPMLGPSSSTLEHMGALSWNVIRENRETWRILTSPWLHSGVFHLFINLGSLIFIGIYMEQEFGPLRIAVIYILSNVTGSLFAAVFARDSPSVCSTAALFGLIGAMLSALIRDWNLYTLKVSAIGLMFMISTLNFLLGFLPYIDNFANIGGFISGLLLGFVLLFTPQLGQVPPHKASFFEGEIKSSTRLKEKLDRPNLRITCLVLFCAIFAGLLLSALQGINLNHYCGWCHYVDCLPTRKWSCNDKTSYCETMVSDAQLTLTCMANGNFRILPYTNISQTRTQELCTLICS